MVYKNPIKAKEEFIESIKIVFPNKSEEWLDEKGTKVLNWFITNKKPMTINNWREIFDDIELTNKTTR